MLLACCLPAALAEDGRYLGAGLYFGQGQLWYTLDGMSANDDGIRPLPSGEHKKSALPREDGELEALPPLRAVPPGREANGKAFFEIGGKTIYAAEETVTLVRLELTDISALAGLRQVKALFLEDNQIADIAPLAGLTRLRWLMLEQNPVQDFSPLKNFKQLTTLELDDTGISDLTPLKALKDLEELHLQGNPITDLTPLEGLKNLLVLYLGDIPGLSDAQFGNLQDALPNCEIIREKQL